MGYCGCSTRRNQVAWTVILVCLTSTTALIFLMGNTGNRMVADYNSCLSTQLQLGHVTHQEYEDYVLKNTDRRFNMETDNKYIEKCMDDNLCSAYPAIFILFCFLLTFILITTVPLCIMCCCSPAPRDFEIFLLQHDGQKQYFNPIYQSRFLGSPRLHPAEGSPVQSQPVVAYEAKV
eukprot:TRINITY_DN8040_c0_g1_i1.p1 TRINITY_DN8040_c0_g1~~TRINITY_DN8040_c0_g1_i1.p1  ORF type:complete len:177 (-),score=11.22 TRINITY_DN8040_c0_g1_i1:289-819(-)